MKRLLEQIDKLEGYEQLQFFVAIIIAGLGIALVANAIMHPHDFEL